MNCAHCHRPIKARGLCNTHYEQLRLNGDALHADKLRGLPLRFAEAAAASTSDACILWPWGTTAGGYGKLYYQGRNWLAHRYVLAFRTGELPEEMDAAHDPKACLHRSCVNGRHLRWATRSENNRDMDVAGTRNPPRGEAHWGYKHGMYAQ